MLQDSRSGNGSLFGDMAYQKDSYLFLLGQPHQIGSRFSYLRNRTGSRTIVLSVDSLYGIYNDYLRLQIINLLSDLFQISF